LAPDRIETLEDHFAANPRVRVYGNLLVFYEEGNKHRHVSPDVFVVKGVERRQRDNSLIWDEGKGPDLVIELTSKSTSDEDEKDKKTLYQDVLGVSEYILFDPKQEYLVPPLQAYRLVEGECAPIELADGRVLSDVLGLHLGREGERLRLYDPKTGRRLPTSRVRAEPAEATAVQERTRAKQERDRAKQERDRAEQADARAEQERARAEQAETRAELEKARANRVEAEMERFRRESEELRRRLEGGG
jgi:Uma2 family endonuclease